MLRRLHLPRASALPLIAALVLAALLRPATAGEAAAAKIPPPSANKGKTGTYHCTTKHAGYNYWVFVPAKYSDEAPAGLHLYFHGQNDQAGANDFKMWDRFFLTPYDLIGINMEYTDGDNTKDTANKVAAAQEAVAQTMADYKIVTGRGVIACFSGGGVTHSLYAQQAAKVRGEAWPFCQTASYSSNYFRNAVLPVPMTWYLGVGTKDWDLANLGVTAVKRTNELLGAQAGGACPDVFFQVILGKDHTILDKDAEVSASLFARADLAFAPFLYAPDHAEPELAPIVEQLNQLELNAGLVRVTKLAKSTATKEKVRTKALALQTIVEARIDRVVELAKTLAADEPVLCNYYGGLLLRQIAGNAKEKELRALLATSAKAKPYQASLAANQEFIKLFPTIFGALDKPVPSLKPEMVKTLTDLLPLLGAQSAQGRMVDDYLHLSGDAKKP